MRRRLRRKWQKGRRRGLERVNSSDASIVAPLIFQYVLEKEAEEIAITKSSQLSEPQTKQKTEQAPMQIT
ncbi:hypothetical protein KJ652_00010 [Patescibacteria group bacterium]|nr:hypothetical protein [Patescibacteria group bacterium]